MARQWALDPLIGDRILAPKLESVSMTNEEREDTKKRLMAAGYGESQAESLITAVRKTFYWILSLEHYLNRIKQLKYYLDNDCLIDEDLQLHLEIIWKGTWGEA